MKIHEAIHVVMKDTKRPLTGREAYELIISKKLYDFKAQDPVHVVVQEIRRRCMNLDFPSAKSEKLFIRLQDGRYSLNTEAHHTQKSALIEEEQEHIAIENELTTTHERYISAFSNLLLEELKSLSPEQFEIFSMNFLKSFGFTNVQVTKRGKDGGIDGHGSLNIGISKIDAAFQCKRWKNSTVGIKPVNEFLGAISGIQPDKKYYDQGYFFTTAKFSKDAESILKRKGATPIFLIDGCSIVKYMLEKRIGVTAEPLYKFSASLDSIINETQ